MVAAGTAAGRCVRAGLEAGEITAESGRKPVGIRLTAASRCDLARGVYNQAPQIWQREGIHP
jgi:hypothetical protein